VPRPPLAAATATRSLAGDDRLAANLAPVQVLSDVDAPLWIAVCLITARPGRTPGAVITARITTAGTKHAGPGGSADCPNDSSSAEVGDTGSRPLAW
jgi:hypothetical protein